MTLAFTLATGLLLALVSPWNAASAATASLTSATQTAEPTTPTLQSIEVSPAGGGQVLVRLHLSAPLPKKPGGFTIRQPARLAVDLPDTALDVGTRFRKFDIGVLRAYAAVAAGGRTRVVFDLSRMVPYTIDMRGNDVLVELGASATAPPATVPASRPAARTSPAAPVGHPVRHSVEHIDFRRGEGGAGRVIVNLSDAHVQVDVKQEGGKVVARFHDTSAPDKLLKRLDVLDFATPVKYIDTRREGRDTDIVVTPVSNGNFQLVSFQTNQQFSLVLEPLTQQEQEARQRKHPRYSGKKITLDFQKVDVRALLQIIADVAKVNMVVSDSVSGQIAIRLEDVPWDQALAIILRSKGLGQRRQGNVIFVAPLKELAERRKVELQSRQQTTQLAPLHSELMQINYAKAKDIAALLKSDNNSILGKRGRVTVDERTNTVLVLDTLDKLSEIRALVRRLDVPVRQVLIKSRIVIANNNFDRQVGAQFGITAVGGLGNNGLITTSGSNAGTSQIVNSFLGNSRNFPVSIPSSAANRYNVNLPISAAGPGTIGLAILGSKYLVDLELQALQAEGMGEVISSPRVITANAKEASIEQGVEIPYQESTSSGATSVSFKKAVMSLQVTPQITPDGRIIMDLAVRKDDIGQVVPTGNGGSVPSIDTRRVTTHVLVNDGQTVVLGGIYENTKLKSVSKIPLLGDIPILGALFRFTEHKNNRTELLVFVTPKIINQALTLSQDN